MEKLFKLSVLSSICVFACYTAIADVPAEQAEEVKHLLGFVKNSGCVINRNGSAYQAEKGVDHIKMKYDYFRDDINSSEEFIEYSATKSTMSGDYYMVTCPGKAAIKTQNWLLAELKKYRSK